MSWPRQTICFCGFLWWFYACVHNTYFFSIKTYLFVNNDASATATAAGHNTDGFPFACVACTPRRPFSICPAPVGIPSWDIVIWLFGQPSQRNEDITDDVFSSSIFLSCSSKTIYSDSVYERHEPTTTTRISDVWG
jgi:hypothetical protein